MLPSRSSGVEDKPAKETDKPHAERQDRYEHLWCLEDQDYFRTGEWSVVWQKWGSRASELRS